MAQFLSYVFSALKGYKLFIIISNRNGLVRDLATLTFGAEYDLKQNIVTAKLICVFVFRIFKKPVFS